MDASAIVAILTKEAGFDQLLIKLSAADGPVTSPIAIYEATLALNRKRQGGIETARQDVKVFIATTGILIETITAGDSDGALNAFARYGKGRGHPAQLNMGDCFAYALAQNRAIPLLYNGNDFSLTDVDG